jgi:hypothetical protein
MALDGSEGGLISLSTAESLVNRYRTNNPNNVKGLFLGKDVLNEILNQEGAMGIRIYLGEDEGKFTVVCVAADEDENDILDKIADSSVPCPFMCSSTGSLK